MAKYFNPNNPSMDEMTQQDFDVRTRIEKILDNNTRDLSNSHWHGSEYGVPEDRYDDVAEEIMTALRLWENYSE